MSVRNQLVAALLDAVPPGTSVIPYQDNLDEPSGFVVMVKQLKLSPLPATPRDAYRVDYVLTMIGPAIDPAVAEPDLDGFVPSLLGDLDGLDWFAWEDATKVLSSGHMAYDVHCWVIAPVVRSSTRKAA